MVATIERTTDYDRFNVLASNRKIYSAHVRHLKEAIAEKPEAIQYNPILTNENLEVIDGQHRLQALKELGYPVYYVIGRGLTVADAQRMNAVQRNWTPLDYAKSFAQNGEPNYQTYLEFREEYRLPHNTLLAYLANSSGVKNINAKFKLGMFKVKDVGLAHNHCQLLMDVGEIYPDYRIGVFTLAYLVLLRHPDYNHKRFLTQLQKYASKFLSKYSNIQDYQRALEKIYNYNRSVESQIRLF